MATSERHPVLVKPSGQGKIMRAPNLTEQVTAALRKEITSGVRERGEALPSEQAMSESFGVSRTVMREAISRLKAEGLVVTHQGRGVFVASQSASWPFRLDGHPENVESILQIVELRLALEVEAAGLAAERRTHVDIDKMKSALVEMADAIRDDELADGVAADFQFHAAVCLATKNNHFVSFFEFLSQYLRNFIEISRYRTSRTKALEYAIRTEHDAILTAIEQSNADAARKAARIHLYNTADRICALPNLS